MDEKQRDEVMKAAAELRAAAEQIVAIFRAAIGDAPWLLLAEAQGCELVAMTTVPPVEVESSVCLMNGDRMIAQFYMREFMDVLGCLKQHDEIIDGMSKSLPHESELHGGLQ